MYLKNIELKNYRNYKQIKLPLERNVNVLIGNNAQGKTNLLEAIYLCCFGKSYRVAKDSELINFGSDYTWISADIENDGHEDNIKILINNNKEKSIMINENKIKKMSELIGYIKVVTFKPEDLMLIKDAPSIRRKFLDTEISQLDYIYMKELQNYNRALLQKNNYLKNTSKIEKDYINIWNKQLVMYGEQIIKKREEYISEINKVLKRVHKNITNGKEDIVVEYKPNIKEDELERELEKTYEEEKRMRVTQVGPHKDDISFYVNGIEMKKFGSQGQQRTCVISLKFSQIEIIKEKSHCEPILLLDDILSELDDIRKYEMLEYINNLQTIITCTEVSDEILEKLKIQKIYKVKNGEIEIKNIH